MKSRTLRDEIAIAAMQAYLTRENPEITGEIMTLDQVANWSYSVADAMLKAREKV